MEKSLIKLENIFSTKYSTNIQLTSQKSNFTTNFPVPLELNKDYNYELGLLWFSCYNTIFNISTDNNKFVILNESSNDVGIIIIPPGAYDITELNNKINEIIPTKDRIKIEIDVPTSKCKLTLYNNWKISIQDISFFHTILGFDISRKIVNIKNNSIPFPGVIDQSQLSENIIKITNISSINIECDCVEGAYINGQASNILYSFPSFTVPSGFKFVERQQPPIYLPLNRKYLNNINIKVVDQGGNLINFNNETITLVLHLKQV